MSKVLVVGDDFFTPNMAGPAVRHLEMAKHLSGQHSVTLAVPNRTELKADNFEIRTYSISDLKGLMRSSDLVISPGLHIRESRSLLNIDVPMAFDFYAGFLENMEEFKLRGNVLRGADGITYDKVRRLLSRGDLFLCHNENLKNLLIGLLWTFGRVNSFTYNNDPSLSELIKIVPYGIGKEPPKKKRNVLKGVMKNINKDDKVILWFGGIWDWLDPITPIKAIRDISASRSDIKLVFIGAKHPNPKKERTKMCKMAMDLAGELGLLDKLVFFIDWIPYEERADYFLESELGIVSHAMHLETTFSSRTRAFELIWGRLPLLISKGDPVSNIVETNSLGVTFLNDGASDLKQKILGVIDDKKRLDEIKTNMERYAPELYWEKQLSALDGFAKNPKRARDFRGSLWKNFARS